MAGKQTITLVNLGRCPRCHQEILMTQAESDICQAETYRRIKAADEFYKREFDTLEFGDEVKIPLPAFPCGHYHTVIKRPVKLENGKFSYINAAQQGNAADATSKAFKVDSATSGES